MKSIFSSGSYDAGYSDPQTQYFVDEVMDNPDDFERASPSRGEIANDSIDSENYTFILVGIEHELFVDFSGTAVPDGFNEGRNQLL